MRAQRTLIAALVLIAAAVFSYSQGKSLSHARASLAAVTPSVIDVGFSQSMLLHHQQAIAMSQIMLDGKPTGLHAFARNIASTQLVELGEMRGWLKLWGEEEHHQADMVWMLLGSAPLDASMQKYVMDCRNAERGMIGLATANELNELRQSEGLKRDRQFIELMLKHHRGGVPMAQFAASEAQLNTVRTMASLIVMEQSREIQHMQNLLAALQTSPAPPKE
ncbi:DUF305 domain-containing protein [Spongiibacter marinus]|uniref:DUF305 domain-containing protein n=1 Tax=Spongiibacter marinus TaxID=354246 RepID=UPI0035BE7B8E